MLANYIIYHSFCLLNLYFCMPFVALPKLNLKRITAAHLLFIIQSIFLARRQLQRQGRYISLYIVFICISSAREIKQHSKQTDATFLVPIDCEWEKRPHIKKLKRRMNLNKFHGVYFRGTVISPPSACRFLPHPTLKVLTTLPPPLPFSWDSPSSLPISSPTLACSAPSPLVFSSRSYYSFTDTFTLCLDEDARGAGAAVRGKWGSIFCYLHWTTKWAAEGKSFKSFWMNLIFTKYEKYS